MRTRYRTACCSPPSASGPGGDRMQHGQGQGGLQGRQQALQGRELSARPSMSTRRRSPLMPDFAEAHFYLASSEQSLYRPGKEGDENRQRLDKAVEHYEKSLEVEQGGHPEPPAVRLNTLGALTAIYAEPPLQNYEKALGLRGAAGQGQPERHQEPLRDGEPLREVQPRAGGRADLREGRAAEPQRRQGLRRRWPPSTTSPSGTTRARSGVEGSKGARRAKFDKAIATLERCADIDPKDPSGHYKLAMFYWDKAYRDPHARRDKREERVRGQGPRRDRQVARDEARLLGGDHHEGPALPRQGPGRQEPGPAQEVPRPGQLLQKQAMDLRKEQQAAAAGRRGRDPEPDGTPKLRRPGPRGGCRRPRSAHPFEGASPDEGQAPSRFGERPPCLPQRTARLRARSSTAKRRAAAEGRRAGEMGRAANGKGPWRGPFLSDAFVGRTSALRLPADDAARLFDHLVGDDPDPLDPRALGDVHRLDDAAVGDRPGGPDEDRLVRARLEDVPEPRWRAPRRSRGSC